jgi:ribosomal protein L30E
MESITDDKLVKKAISNNISYIINKKMKTYDDRLEYLTEKVEENIKISNSIIELLKSKNIILESKSTTESKKNDIKEIVLVENNNSYEENIDIIIKKSDNITINEYKADNNDVKDKNELKIVKEKRSEEKNIYLINNYKDLKRELFNFDELFIKDCLNLCSLQGDLKIFKKMYIDGVSKEFYPIRHIKKKLQYWLDNHMNDDDANGTYVKHIIIKNIEDCYLAINTFDNYKNNVDQLLKNQEHINKLSEEKYKDKLLNKIINIITI